MNIKNNHKNTPPNQLLKRISFVKSFPKNVPVFILCSFPNYADVRMLVIHEYYHNNSFRCTILIIYPPYIPQGYYSSTEKLKEISINVDIIKDWKLMHLEKSDEIIPEEIETAVTI